MKNYNVILQFRLTCITELQIYNKPKAIISKKIKTTNYIIKNYQLINHIIKKVLIKKLQIFVKIKINMERTEFPKLRQFYILWVCMTQKTKYLFNFFGK